MEESAMLVLGRKVGEKIHIGSDITITVLLARGNKIRLGIEAPESVPVLRAELHDFLVEPKPAPPARTVRPGRPLAAI
jgi:carbon storage regulator CsrA